MRALAIIPLLVVSSHAPAADLISAVPDRFVGEWNASLSDCGTANNDSRLLIGKDHITFWDSDGPVKAVVAEGRYEIALILHLSGEGETWIATEHFKLPRRRGADLGQPSRRWVRSAQMSERLNSYRCPLLADSGRSAGTPGSWTANVRFRPKADTREPQACMIATRPTQVQASFPGSMLCLFSCCWFWQQRFCWPNHRQVANGAHLQAMHSSG